MSNATLSIVEVRESLVALAGTWGKAVAADRKLSAKTSDAFQAGLDLIGKREDGKNWGLDGYFKKLYSDDPTLIPETVQVILNADKKDPDSDAGIVKNRWSVMLCTLQSPKKAPVKGDEMNTVMAALERLLTGERRAECIGRLEGLQDSTGIMIDVDPEWEPKSAE